MKRCVQLRQAASVRGTVGGKKNLGYAVVAAGIWRARRCSADVHGASPQPRDVSEQAGLAWKPAARDVVSHHVAVLLFPAAGDGRLTPLRRVGAGSQAASSALRMCMELLCSAHIPGLCECLTYH